MVAEREVVDLSDDDAVLRGIRDLPPHPEVEGALSHLRDEG